MTITSADYGVKRPATPRPAPLKLLLLAPHRIREGAGTAEWPRPGSLPGYVKIHQESDGTYGAPRITAELRDEGGLAVNHERVARIMRNIGLEGVRLRRRHRTTVADQVGVEGAGPDRP